MALTWRCETAPDTPRDEIVIRAARRSGRQGRQPVARAGRGAAARHGRARASSIVDVAERLASARASASSRATSCSRSTTPENRPTTARARARRWRSRRRALWRITIQRGGQQSLGRTARMSAARQAPRRPTCSRRRASSATRRGRLPTGCGRTKLAEVVGQDHLLGPDGALTPHARDAHAGLAGVLGAAGHRQDHGGAAAGAGDRSAFRADLGDLLRRRRPQEGLRGGARAARERAGARCSSSTRSTASTARSRIPSCR